MRSFLPLLIRGGASPGANEKRYLPSLCNLLAWYSLLPGARFNSSSSAGKGKHHR